MNRLCRHVFPAFVCLLLSACAAPQSAPATSPTDDRAEADDDNVSTSEASKTDERTSGSDTAGEPTTNAEKPAYDARLSGYEYPFEVSTFTVDAQGGQHEIAYMDVQPDGEPTGTVLLLHGKNFSGAYWERTIESLVDRGYRAIAPDQIGFGKSSKPTDFQYSFHALATYTSRLLDERGIDDVSVVGHSMGGMLATRFALMFPDRTHRLALVNPIGLEDWKREVPYLTVDEWYQRELDKTPNAVRQYMKTSYFDGQWREAYDPLVEIQAGWIRGPDYQQIARVSALTYNMIFTQPVLYEFSRLQFPTLLLIGQRDRTALGTDLVEPDIAETMGRYDELDEDVAAMIPDSTLVELDDVGHIPQFEAYDRYIESLTDFLAE